ncbi:MAG: hypothetical protein JOY84_17685 [Curvibacter sp.]|nr:hypothetical protein [Curvibacter sp.]
MKPSKTLPPATPAPSEAGGARKAEAPLWAQGAVAWPFRAAPSLSARARKPVLPRKRP